MSGKIRVLSDHLANQIAAGEVVERPASVAKELVENAIDAGARRVEVEIEAGGRRLLRVVDDGEGMTRDDAVLAFERHATSKISRVEDLQKIRTLGFRGEALASISSVARVELVTQMVDEPEATRVLVEGGRMRDVQTAAHPRGTTVSVRDLFFNVPARRKFLRSEATESFHLVNLITHYALAHPEIAFALVNNGRETLRAAPAADVRERAYQLFGSEFLDNLLEVNGGQDQIARVRGYVSAPRERRTSRDAQYLFVNGRDVRDRLISRALGEGYRAVLPQGTYPAALLFLDVPLEEVDVNVHPAKTEVRFRRAAAVGEVVQEAVRAALAANGYVRVKDDAATQTRDEELESTRFAATNGAAQSSLDEKIDEAARQFDEHLAQQEAAARRAYALRRAAQEGSTTQPNAVEFDFKVPMEEDVSPSRAEIVSPSASDFAPVSEADEMQVASERPTSSDQISITRDASRGTSETGASASVASRVEGAWPPLVSAAGFVREVPVEALSSGMRPLGQLAESYIIATDREGLLLIDQHIAHERILFDEYRRREASRPADGQHLLMPETFDLTPAQAAAFDSVAADLETYGFSLMRLSGRTIAIKAVPADLPACEARGLLAEVLDAVETEKRSAARSILREQIAAALACHAAVKSNTPLAPEKMRWLIENLLKTSSPTTSPHGRPVILRLATRDIERNFHRS